MCRLFETVRVSDGVPLHLQWHEKRMNHAREEIWGSGVPLELQPEIAVPPDYSMGLVQCNIYYGPEIQQVSFKRYEKRMISSLKMVDYPAIDYHLKYADRSLLEFLFGLRGGCDEVIVVKQGFVTDTSVSNLIFYDGKSWFTPANPLLKGTCRDRLLAEGRIIECDIHTGELHKYYGCKLINAMRYPEEEEMIAISEIK